MNNSVSTAPAGPPDLPRRQQISPYILAAVLIMVLSVAFFRLGSFTLFDVDEAVFAEATREMVESGNWLTPTYNGANRYDKPIFFYWFMALSYKVFGINEAGARVPSAVAGVLLCGGLFLYMKKLTEVTRALYAVLAFALSLYFVLYTHAAVTDMTLTLFITLSLLSFHLWLRLPGASAQARFYCYGFYGCAALAFLTKGLIGIVFPFGIAGCYLLATEGLHGLKKLFSIRGTLLFLLLAGPWYAAELQANGWEFIDQFFIRHHFRRYTGAMEGHWGPWYYYLPVLIVGLSPWVVYLPRGVSDAVAELKQARSREGLGRHHSPLPLALLWLCFILLFFSCSTTKLPNYILPAVPAAVILIAFGMSGATGTYIRSVKVLSAVVALGLGVGALLAGGYLEPFGFTDRTWLRLLFVVLLGGAALHLAGAVRRKADHGAVAVLMLLFLLLFFSVLPFANTYLQGTLHTFSLYAKETLPADGKLITYKLDNPSIVFYAGRRVLVTDTPERVEQQLQGAARAVIITRTAEITPLLEKGLVLVKSDAAYALLERK